MDKRWLLRGMWSWVLTQEYPRLPIRLVKFLDEYITKDMRVFEWGTGISSYYFYNRCYYYGVEHDESWYNKIRIPNINLTTKKEKYIHNFKGKGKADICIMDGEWRNDVIKIVDKYAKDNALIILDDNNRSEYNHAILDKKYPFETFGGFRFNTCSNNSKGYFEKNTTKVWFKGDTQNDIWYNQ